MNRSISILLWTLTAVAAVALSLATTHLAERARLEAPLGKTMYVDGGGAWTRMWPHPAVDDGESALIERGTQVAVQQLEVIDGGAWYYVQGPLHAGWIRAKNLVDVQPE